MSAVLEPRQRLSEPLAAFHRGFAGPFAAFDETLFEYAVVEHGRETLLTFLRDHGLLLQTRCGSVARFLQGAAGGELSLAAFWSSEFGRLAACTVAASTAANEVCDAALGMAGRLATEGVDGRSTCEPCWPAPRPLTPPAQHAENGVVFITEGVRNSPNHAYLADSLLPGERVFEAVQMHRQAMALLETGAPGYARWVRRLLRGVIPLETRSGGINSGSSRDEPGVVHASIDCPVEGYAEMLVHEVSHQHVYALSRLGPLHDGSDTALYFSPVKNMGRPISMILLAFHAFANVVLMGRQCAGVAALAGSDYFPRNEAFLLPQLATLEQGLTTSTALTPLGRALWQPLAEQLAATRSTT